MLFPFFKHIYYYVPPCPKCGSKKTGRYIRAPFTGAGFTREESLKNGEIVRFSIEEPINNAFCVSCGYEWPERIKTKFLSYAEIHEEQLARGTQSQYEKLLEGKEKSKWDVENFFRSRYEKNHNYVPETENTEKRLEPEIIDSRKRDRIELLYADENLLMQVRQVQEAAR